MIVIVRRVGFLVLSLGFIIWTISLGMIIESSNTINDVIINTTDRHVVVIDAGHGGIDGGTHGLDTNILEKDLNLSIAKEIEKILTKNNYKVILTRTDDDSIHDDNRKTIRSKKKSDMQNRLNITKTAGADIFVSIHMNSFSQRSQRGAQVFYSSHDKEKAMFLAKCIQDGLNSNLQSPAKAIKKADGSVYIMKNAVIPSALVECGFLSNSEDEKLLSTKEYQEKLANLISEGIESYYLNSPTPSPKS